MILARHAESLLWAGRYLERTEVTSRWLDVANRFTMNLLPVDAEAEWRILIDALGMTNIFEPTLGSGTFDQAIVSAALLSDNETAGSVAIAVESLRDNLRIVRDRVPVELWEEVNRLHMSLADSVAASSVDGAPHRVFRAVREGCQAISGVLSESMMRDEGHAFIVIGRMIERSTSTVRLLRAALSRSSGPFDSDRILRSSSALQAYRRVHGHRSDQESVTIFLLRTPGLPRSVFSCLLHAEGRLRMVDPGAQRTTRTQQLAGRLRSNLEFGDFSNGVVERAPSLLDELEVGLNDLAATLSNEVFRPLGEPVLHAQFVRPGRNL